MEYATLMRQNKQELRDQLRAARHAVSQEQRAMAATKLCNNVLALPFFSSAKNVALYWPADSEIDTLPLLDRCLNDLKHCFLPILCLGDRHSLSFASYTLGVPMIKNRYEIIEPDISYAATIAAADLDIIFVPLVGFDSKGYRLGRGGGYYDATFDELSREKNHKWPKLVGLGYEIQKVEELPHDSWDWQLDAVVTETQVYEYSTVSK